ncbi:hypothetical protein LWI28_019407 [Acer negundo]|uniref:Uncharacterized protein n=1 Tax=Acer negundo TaxID=4023 RepID=A0AAD5I6Q1_ACENE|nr:hypothetical protein LWI28_019407 [Acer negundo]
MGADEILTAEGEKDAVINKITLFMLNSIVLEDLPSLTSFYSGSNTLECPSLKIIDIKACPEMETFVFPNTMDLSIHSASFFSKKAISWCLQNLTGMFVNKSMTNFSDRTGCAVVMTHVPLGKLAGCIENAVPVGVGTNLN